MPASLEDRGGGFDAVSGLGLGVAQHRLVSLIIHSDQVVAGETWPAPDTVDIVPTLLNHLDIDVDAELDLDGRVLGTTATAPPLQQSGVSRASSVEPSRGRGMRKPNLRCPPGDQAN